MNVLSCMNESWLSVWLLNPLNHVSSLSLYSFPPLPCGWFVQFLPFTQWMICTVPPTLPCGWLPFVTINFSRLSLWVTLSRYTRQMGSAVRKRNELLASLTSGSDLLYIFLAFFIFPVHKRYNLIQAHPQTKVFLDLSEDTCYFYYGQ